MGGASLYCNALVVTMDDAGRELDDGWLLVRAGVVETVGNGSRPSAEETLDLSGAGVRVGLGVDGSAWNERSDLVCEVKQALLVARGRGGPTALIAREPPRLAARGGATVPGRDDLGNEPGKRADFPVWRTDGPEFGGATEPVFELVLAGPHRVERLVVGGEDIVRGGVLMRAVEAEIAREHRRQAARVAA